MLYVYLTLPLFELGPIALELSAIDEISGSFGRLEDNEGYSCLLFLTNYDMVFIFIENVVSLPDFSIDVIEIHLLASG